MQNIHKGPVVIGKIELPIVPKREKYDVCPLCRAQHQYGWGRLCDDCYEIIDL